MKKKKTEIRKLLQFFARKRLPLEETEDSDVYSLRKKQTILFFVCAVRESQKDSFRIYVCKEEGENTPDDPIIESKLEKKNKKINENYFKVDLKGKKPWKTFVDPLGGHIIISCLKDNQTTPKHLYVNVYQAEEEFKKKKKPTEVFTYQAKGEFELKAELKTSSGDVSSMNSQNISFSGLTKLSEKRYKFWRFINRR